MPRMAWWGTLLVAAALAAQGAREVEALDLDREGVALLQVAGTAPADGVTDLDDQIKTLQKDISDIRAKKSAAAAAEQAASEDAKMTEGTVQDEHIKKSITHKAAQADLDAAEKAKQAAIDTLKQQQKTDGTHDSAHGGASDSGAATASDHSHAMYPADDAGGYGKAGATGGGGYGGGLTTPEQNTALFTEWHAKWGAMRTKLTGIVQQGIAEVASQHTQVNTHMELVEKAYNREYHGHVSAIAKAKEFNSKESAAKAAEKKAKAAEQAAKHKMKEALEKAQERQAKAVEKEHKAMLHQKQLKESFEAKVKAFHQNDCGPAKEGEQKAKAEIKRLQAVNVKLRKDCEVKSKEMKSKSEERLTKSKEKTTKETARADALAAKLQAAKQRIVALTAELRAAKAQIAKLKEDLAASQAETAKQKALKEAAEAKVADLTARLAAMTAKYNKCKSTMSHINQVSDAPDKQ
jgi:hypothetical protein